MTKQESRVIVIRKELARLFPHPVCALSYGNPFELLIAVIMSAQCTDKKVNEVTAKLFKKYRTLDDYVSADPKEFEKDIFQTGFYRSKTKHILATARMIQEKFEGRVPCTMNELLTLRGVARKTANVVLGNVCNVVEGIAVDTHVKRLSRKLGLTKNTDPVKIERDLMKIIPQNEWFVFTYRLIEYGRKYCPARNHAHQVCPLEIALTHIK